MKPAMSLFGRFDHSDADVKKAMSGLEIDQLDHEQIRRELGLDTHGIAAARMYTPKPTKKVPTVSVEDWRALIFRLTDYVPALSPVLPPDSSPS